MLDGTHKEFQLFTHTSVFFLYIFRTGSTTFNGVGCVFNCLLNRFCVFGRLYRWVWRLFIGINFRGLLIIKKLFFFFLFFFFVKSKKKKTLFPKSTKEEKKAAGFGSYNISKEKKKGKRSGFYKRIEINCKVYIAGKSGKLWSLILLEAINTTPIVALKVLVDQCCSYAARRHTRTPITRKCVNFVVPQISWKLRLVDSTLDF